MRYAFLGQTETDKAENLMLSLWLLRKEHGTEGGVAPISTVTNSGLHAAHSSGKKGTSDRGHATSSSVADRLVPALLRAVIRFGLYRAWRVNY